MWYDEPSSVDYARPWRPERNDNLMRGKVYSVGTDEEVAHHAVLLAAKVDVEIIEPDRIVDVATDQDDAVSANIEHVKCQTGFVKLKNVQNITREFFARLMLPEGLQKP